MNDTPRTEKQIHIIETGDGVWKHFVPDNFARQLEREVTRLNERVIEQDKQLLSLNRALAQKRSGGIK